MITTQSLSTSDLGVSTARLPRKDEIEVISPAAAVLPSAAIPNAFLDAFVGVNLSPQQHSATPTAVLIGTLPDPRLRLKRPLELSVEREDETVGVCLEEIGLFGAGPHLSAAIEDFQLQFIELTISLLEDGDTLGSEMTRILESLSAVVERSSWP